MGVTPPPAPGAGAAPRKKPAQWARRLLYGGNAAVSVAAAAALTLLVVWFAGFVVERAPGAAAGLVRLDLTENRRFSLSPRTVGVLESLDAPVEVVRVGPASTEADLFGRVERAGGEALSVEALDPGRDPEAWRAFQRRVHEVTGGEPVVAAAAAGLDAAEAVAAGYAEAAELLAEAADGLGSEEAADQLRGDAATLVTQETAIRGQVGTLRPALDQPLPGLSAVREPLLGLLRTLADQQLPAMLRYLSGRAGDRRAAPGARDAAIRAGRVLDRVTAGLRPAAATLAETPEPPDHARAAAGLAQGRAVAVVRGDRVRVFPLEEGDDPAVIEERLAAALLTVNLPEPPVLVWVDSEEAPALGASGSFNAVAGRARDAGFEIARLPLGPGPLPEPSFAPGRPVVWAVPPVATPDNQDDGPVSRLSELLQRRLAAGDGVLWVPGFRSLGRYAAADPLLTLGEAAGVGVPEGSLVLRLAAGEGEGAEPVASPRFEVPFGLADEDPGADAGTRVRAALGTGVAFLELPGPLELEAPAVPLLTVADEGLWVEEEPLETGRLADARPGGGEARDAQVVAALAEPAGGGRLAVFADGLMFRDPVLQRTRRSANADLFAATCLWLAGLDEAVVAAPSVGVGKMVPAIEPGTRQALQLALVGGLPLLAAAAGLGVAWWRRR